ncbi:MAG: hypothetical protein LBR92_02205, partial [Puniceicoccales bacterium]|nr:hypothetical protein [Puniceicoccales bacterium]
TAKRFSADNALKQGSLPRFVAPQSAPQQLQAGKGLGKNGSQLLDQDFWRRFGMPQSVSPLPTAKRFSAGNVLKQGSLPRFVAPQSAPQQLQAGKGLGVQPELMPQSKIAQNPLFSPVTNAAQPSIQASGNGKTQSTPPKKATPEPDFIEVPPSFENWEKATGAWLPYCKDVAAVSKLTPQEMLEWIGGGNTVYLCPTAVLKDQAPAQSKEQNFADHIFRSVEQGIQADLPTVMTELNKFSRKSEFSARELKWIEFLAGGTVSEFCYPNCQAFRKDSDANLESKHDYIQVVFPSYEASAHANQDLYIKDKIDTWKALIKACPTLKRNIRLNMQLNAIRMLHFWGFKFAFEQDVPNMWNTNAIRTFVVLKDNPNSPLHEHGNHNTLRATRFIEALEMFGSFHFSRNFSEGLLPKYYSKHPSYSYWIKAFEMKSKINLY